MTDRRSFIGILATVIWIALVAYLLLRDPVGVGKMTPNDWGSFLSGVFAPLGFLWLVLGYLQQGEELRLSTEALRLQAEELKNSVQQQKELVEVTRLQVEAEKEALAYERRQRDEEARPYFAVGRGGGSFRGDGHSNYSFILSNTGNAATALLVDMISSGGQSTRLLDVPLFERGKQQGLNYETLTPFEGDQTRLLLSFKDVLGKQYQVKYQVSREADHPHSLLFFTEVEA